MAAAGSCESAAKHEAAATFVDRVMRGNMSLENTLASPWLCSSETHVSYFVRAGTGRRFQALSNFERSCSASCQLRGNQFFDGFELDATPTVQRHVQWHIAVAAELLAGTSV